MGIGNSFPGVKRPGLEADYSPPSNTDVKDAWTYLLPETSSRCGTGITLHGN
jgi:hypothetical protein